MTDKSSMRSPESVVVKDGPYHKKYGNVLGPFLVVDPLLRQNMFPVSNGPGRLIYDDGTSCPKFVFTNGTKYYVPIDNLVLVDLKSLDDWNMFLMIHPHCESERESWHYYLMCSLQGGVH